MKGFSGGGFPPPPALGQHEPMDNGAAPEKKSPVEQAFEVFVYAPLGLALEARTLMPRLVERGRQQIMMNRMIGKFVVRQGQTETAKALGKAGDRATSVLADLGLLPREGDVVTPPGPAPTAAAPAAPAAPAVAAAPTAEPAPVVEVLVVPVEDPDVELAIADFDSLAASQVIPRLPGLSGAELEAVRNYEAAHRGRKTVLNRIAQLQSA